MIESVHLFSEMKVLVLTIFLSLLLAVLFLILFLLELRNNEINSLEQDALRPFEHETPKIASRK